MRLPGTLSIVFTVAILLPYAAPSQQLPAATCVLRPTTDPAGARLNIGEVQKGIVAPVDTTLPPGSYRIEASDEGYNPLVYDAELSPGDTLALEFILLAEQPEKPTPGALGMEYHPIVPLLMEDQADAVRKKYNSMAEIFAILPLSQGVMAILALDGASDYYSGELVAVGVCLSLGSYLLGRKMASRKLNQIRETNETLDAQNAAAEAHNKDVELEIRRIHAEAMREWQAEAAWRGRVEIID